MPRPVLETISMLEADWYQKINNNFEKLLDFPFPIYQLTSGGAPEANFTPDFNPSFVTESPSYTFESIAGSGYSNYVLPSVSKSGGCYLSGTVGTGPVTNIMFGIIFGSPPSAVGSIHAMNFEIFPSSLSETRIYEGSTVVNTLGATSAGDFWEIEYVGTNVDVRINNVSVHSQTVTAGQDVFFDCTLFQSGNIMEDLGFYTAQPVSLLQPAAKKFQNCIGVYEGILYWSDGVNWKQLDYGELDFVADLDTGTATLNDIKDAYNSLLADMQLKGWMST
jgi:hypothetical protein